MKVAFCGLGIMGRPMALNLIKAGYKLVVTSRSQGPIDAPAAAGAKAVKTPCGPLAENFRFMVFPLSVVAARGR